jgi:hypothetical protein
MAEIITASRRKVRKPQKRTRVLWDQIMSVVGEYERMSVRQLFYQMVSRGYVEKVEEEYDRVQETSVQMRLAGVLPYRKIVDGGRERRQYPTYSDMDEALANTANVYRRNHWITQEYHVEVWCEKDALSGIIGPICNQYGVTYVACRGFPSLTIRYESAQEFIRQGKPAIVFYFGDHDASGRSISSNLEEELRQHGAFVSVIRMALEPAQIAAHSLPTRPNKKTDSRRRKFAEEFGDASVELDALPPDVLADMVRESIESTIDVDEWNRITEIEALERMTMESLADAGFEPGSTYRTAS